MAYSTPARLEKEEFMARKPPSCTLQELIDAGPIEIKFGPIVIGELVARQFSTGSYGYSHHGKVLLPMPNGKTAYMQCSVHLTVFNSKDANAQS